MTKTNAELINKRRELLKEMKGLRAELETALDDSGHETAEREFAEKSDKATNQYMSHYYGAAPHNNRQEDRYV